MAQFQNVRGTLDFFPDEKAVQNKVFSILKDTANNFGFLEVETPAFEYTKLLVAKSGEEIKEQIFNLQKKSTEELSLRPELTPGITRIFIDKQKNTPKPVKWYGLSRMWRYEAPQKGRLREFYQLSVELFGSDRPESDAEIISLSIECLLNLGLKEKDFVLKINNRKLLQGFIEELGIKNFESVTRIIDKRQKISPKEFEDELKSLKLNQKQIETLKDFLETKDISKLKEFKLNDTGKKGLDELSEILSLLPYKNIQFDPSTVRGLAYYTGTVFEIFDDKGKFRSIAGGGRYDNLVEILGGVPTPATGFGLGYATLMLLLTEKGLVPKTDLGVDYFIALAGDNIKDKAIDLALKLRKKYKVDINLVKRNLGKQFAYADSIKAKNVIVIGEEELKTKTVKVKDMKTGKEKSVKMSELLK